MHCTRSAIRNRASRPAQLRLSEVRLTEKLVQHARAIEQSARSAVHLSISAQQAQAAAFGDLLHCLFQTAAFPPEKLAAMQQAQVQLLGLKQSLQSVTEVMSQLEAMSQRVAEAASDYQHLPLGPNMRLPPDEEQLPAGEGGDAAPAPGPASAFAPTAASHQPPRPPSAASLQPPQPPSAMGASSLPFPLPPMPPQQQGLMLGAGAPALFGAPLLEQLAPMPQDGHRHKHTEYTFEFEEYTFELEEYTLS